MPSWLQYVWKWIEIIWIPISTVLGIVLINFITFFLGGEFEQFTSLDQWRQLAIAAAVASIRPALGAILAWFTQHRRGNRS